MSQRPIPMRHKAGKFLAFCNISRFCLLLKSSSSSFTNLLITEHRRCTSIRSSSSQHNFIRLRQLSSLPRRQLSVKKFSQPLREEEAATTLTIERVRSKEAAKTVSLAIVLGYIFTYIVRWGILYIL